MIPESVNRVTSCVSAIGYPAFHKSDAYTRCPTVPMVGCRVYKSARDFPVNVQVNPLVSIVIPTYNRCDLLFRAIESARKQTYACTEIIVVDDNSSDETERRIRRLDSDLVHYVRHPENRGGAGARNSGIMAAKGEYIAFLDDDDEWEHNKIQRQLQAIGRCDAILCAARLMSTGKVDQVFNKSRIELSDLKRGFVFGSGTSAILIKTEVARSLLFDEALPFNQDWEFMVRLVQQGDVAYVSDPLVLFNDGQHGRITNSTRALSPEEIEKRLLAVQKHKDFLGPYWVKYHTARRMLAYLRERDNKFSHISKTVDSCGLLPILMVYFNRLKIKYKRI